MSLSVSLVEVSRGSFSDWEDFLHPPEFSKYVGVWSHRLELVQEFGVCCDDKEER